MLRLSATLGTLAILGAAVSACSEGGTSNEGQTASSSAGAANEYIRKSKAVEAKVNLRRMYDGIRAYSMEERFDEASMGAAANGLPAESVGPTPALGSCCEQGGKCQPNADDWKHPTWKAMYMKLSDPHYYSYEYQKISETEFKVIARGDLDCDGTNSTYELNGTLGPDGVGPAPELVATKPLE